ncbi:hypothetical protein BC826DRAFT_886072, partial [Russula brevipes]
LGPLGLSLAPYVHTSHTHSKSLKPIAKQYANISGYRRWGLNVFLQALTRLTPRESYDHAFRFKHASQASVLHKELPEPEWVNS